MAKMLDGLLESLRISPLPNVFNPWTECDPLDVPGAPAEARRSRLRQHFDVSPKYILVGEAPGFNGCHFSGVPFTDEKLIVDGEIPRVRADGRLTTLPKPFSEGSSKRVWKVLRELKIKDEVLLWNAFPWHPHQAGHPCLNRKPAGEELRLGLPILREILTFFRGVPVIPIGNEAEKALKKPPLRDLCVVLEKVIHPANREGGIRLFREQLRAVIEKQIGK